MKRCGYASSKRGAREERGDHFVADQDLGLFIVADGMDGRADATLAARAASQVVLESFRAGRAIFDNYDDRPTSRLELAQFVDRTVQSASAALYGLAAKRGKRQVGMGTTLTLLQFLGNKALMAHVGDSRLYLVRTGEALQLSQDHTYVAELVALGALTPDEARTSPLAHTITRSLGLQPSTRVDQLLFDVAEGDRFLLCSDALIRGLDACGNDVGVAMSANFDETLPDRLIATSARGTGDDDTKTAIVVLAGPQPSSNSVAPASHRQQRLQDRLKLLAHIDLFKSLTQHELLQVLSCMQVQNAAAGERVFSENDTGDALYILESGAARVARGGVDVADLAAGAQFGEMALLRDAPRSASILTTAPSRLLKLARVEFDSLLKARPATANKVLHNLARTLADRLAASNIAATGE